jgi:hypothetical protein
LFIASVCPGAPYPAALAKGSAEDFQIRGSKEYGASFALLELAKELGLDRALYSRKEA